MKKILKTTACIVPVLLVYYFLIFKDNANAYGMLIFRSVFYTIFLILLYFSMLFYRNKKAIMSKNVKIGYIIVSVVILGLILSFAVS